MNRILKILAALALMCLGSTPAFAVATSGFATHTSTIDAQLLAAGTNWPVVWIDFCGYHACDDGGGGLFHRETCTPDGGTCIADSVGHTFARLKVNGEFAQFGLTIGSVYDAVANPTTVQGASNIIANAITALTAKGIYDFHTGQVSLKIGTSISVPAHGSLNCDITPQVLNAGQYKSLPGTLWLSPGARIIAPSRSTVPAEHCNILPGWYLNPALAIFTNGNTSITTPPATFADVEGIRQNMIAAGDVAIECDADNCGPHDLLIAGFDTGLYGSRSSHLNAQNLDIDANVAVYGFSGGGQTDYNGVNSEPVITKQPTGVDNEEYWSITGLAASGTHTNAAGDAVCQFTLAHGIDKTGASTTYDTHDIHTSVVDAQGSPISYPVWTANIKAMGNSSGCNLAGGAASVISASGTGSSSTAVVDILGSDFGGPTVKGQWASGTNIIYIRGSAANIHVGQVVTSAGTGFPGGSPTVKGVLHAKGPDPADAFGAEVILSASTTAAQATDVNVVFTNPTFSASGSNCDGGKNGFCFFLNTAERKYSGTSEGGIATALLPASNGKHYGASFLFNSVAGPRLVNAFAYGHHYGYVLLNSNNASIVQEAGDDNGELDDADQVYFAEYAGSNSATITTNKNSKSGTSIIDDTFQLNDDTVTTTSSAIAGLGTGTGSLAVVSTTDFLANGGTLAICTAAAAGACDQSQPYEYANYTVVDGTHLNINLRGQFATAPHTFAGTVTLFNEIVSNSKGCVSVLGVNTPVTTSYLNAYELHHGCLQLTNTRGNGMGFGFVSHNASSFQAVGNFMPGITPYFEDSTARSVANSLGNICATVTDCNNTQNLTVAGKQIGLGAISAVDYGVVGDGQFTTAPVTSDTSSHTLTFDSSVTFTAADVGKSIFVGGIGAAGANFTSTIKAFNSAHSIDVTDLPGTTVSTTTEEIDWGTDNAKAFNDWCSAIRAAAPYATNAGSVRADISQGIYYVSAGIECAGISNGHATRVVAISGNGAQIIGSAVTPGVSNPSGIIFDGLGSPAVRVLNLSIYGGLKAGNAKYGFVQGRFGTQATQNYGAAGADDACDGIVVAGWFDGGMPYLNSGAEDVVCRDAKFNNYSTTAGSYTAGWDGVNHRDIKAVDPVTYANVNAVDTIGTFDDVGCDNCRFGAVANGQAAIFLANVRGFNLNGGVIRSTGTASYGVDLWGTVGTIINPHIHTHMENTNLAANIRITGSSTSETPTISGVLDFEDSANVATTSIVALDTSHVASATIVDFTPSVRGTTNAPNLFDDPTKYTVRHIDAKLYKGVVFNAPTNFGGGSVCSVPVATYQCQIYGTTIAGVMIQNVLANPDFLIWQENTTYSPVASSRTSIADGWKVLSAATATDGTRTYSQTAGFSTAQYALKVQRQAGNAETGLAYVGQQISSANTIQMLQGKSATLAADVCYGANFSPSGNALLEQFITGTGMDETWAVAAFPTGSVTTSWAEHAGSGPGTCEHVSFGTITVPANATEAGLRIAAKDWVGTAGANDWWSITNVNLTPTNYEPATFVHPSYFESLTRAQLSYRKTFPYATVPAQNAGVAGALCTVGTSTTAGALGLQWQFGTAMRASPTITTYNPSAANANWRDTTAGADAVVQVDTMSAKDEKGVFIGEQTTAPVAADKYCIQATADARQ